MDREVRAPAEPEVGDHGWYLRRAESLLAARAELFAASPGQPAPVVSRTDRPVTRTRAGSRQLSLPLPRERGRRRARMLG